MNGIGDLMFSRINVILILFISHVDWFLLVPSKAERGKERQREAEAAAFGRKNSKFSLLAIIERSSAMVVT